ncbi:hypothetical protein [Nocardiopsis synnemataformans]|uniref:hypothetical protein n=1 Tax=Nocardiopsis synnemataformans TaxID=61305 RepID=UPI003EB95AA0
MTEVSKRALHLGVVDLAQRAYEELERSPTVDSGLLGRLLTEVGRVEGPGLVARAWTTGRISDQVLSEHLAAVWSLAEYPDTALPRLVWRRLFDAAGYTVDGVRADRPAGEVVLWRGSVTERRTDWSWTPDQRVAAQYAAGGVGGRPLGQLWQVTAPPEALLAFMTTRGEDEYVMDTTGLQVDPGS